ncbi:hypothetical protein [Methylobacterium oxalidis]|uniref:Uncharacterized protein n=1 Tax=Methylobacterium oxalidis TaxID=944322 RepID=A0A512J767_9HYPH|nr:hypothetical protein [Methylobacterium oxalidis]GEP05815.1 hypothetical protein MOX02_38530 [Methylobacterium oxalidis]GJE34401.1 hypothetical protein LDDCCGHA_4612 [Methylobacterium oxalidis]GLS66480.1 hypothetical protein GCM10007888_48630 [Methylobacterium oxalidis]
MALWRIWHGDKIISVVMILTFLLTAFLIFSLAVLGVEVFALLRH